MKFFSILFFLIAPLFLSYAKPIAVEIKSIGICKTKDWYEEDCQPSFSGDTLAEIYRDSYYTINCLDYVPLEKFIYVKVKASPIDEPNLECTMAFYCSTSLKKTSEAGSSAEVSQVPQVHISPEMRMDRLSCKSNSEN